MKGKIMKTTNLAAVLAVAVIFVFNSYAQTTSSKEPVNSLKGGKWAVSFLIGTEVTPDYIGSINLNLKSHVSKVFAIRLGVSAYLNSGDGNNSFDGRNYPQNETATNANLYLNFLFYTSPSKPFTFFAGLGPVYQYSERKYEYLSDPVIPSSSTHTSERGSSFGGIGVLGAEWFAYPGFSISAEYNISITFGNQNRTSTFVYTPPFGSPDYDVTVTSLDTKTFNFNIVKIGVSAYF
jgi:hypothetical protein